MDNDRWNQVDQLLQSALDIPAEERDAYLRHACAGDQRLEAEVRSLLAAHDRAGTFLAAPAIDLAARNLAGGHGDDGTQAGPSTSLRAGGDPLIGQTLSHYRIVGKLGGGGMGVVYKAEDGRLQRPVALKFVSDDLAGDDEALSRFQREARTASALNHPHICTIYDIGEQDGRSFIAMEYMEGMTTSLRCGRVPTRTFRFSRKHGQNTRDCHRKVSVRVNTRRAGQPMKIHVYTSAHGSMVGTSLSHYEILAPLGVGGMGVVYKARDTRLDRLAAIKILKNATADEDCRRRFSQEAKAASALNHPGIITIYDVARHGDVDFIAMEYVEGMTVEELIAQKALSLPAALDYAIQAARALAKAHTAGIIHRDLKPSNIMVTADGLVKILDFGVAKLVGRAEIDADVHATAVTRTVAPMDAALTNEGRVVGTVAYMSPEQASGEKVDARSDIFSFGSVLYEMVTGSRAFAAASSIATVGAVVHLEPRPIAEINAKVPRELDRIITRCLRKDPARRFQHLDDVAVELEEVRLETGTRTRGTLAARGRRKPWVMAAAATVAVVAGISWAMWPATEPPSAPLSISKLTAFPGDEAFPALSPDGRQVAFAWNGEHRDNGDVYIKHIDADTPLRLTTDPAEDIAPAWSNDGTRLAFVRRTEGAAAIYLTELVPGTERKLAEYAPPLRGYPAFVIRPYALAWSSDGKSVLVAARPGGDRPNAILAFPVDGGEARTVLSLADGEVLFPSISSDGRFLAYTVCKLGCDIYAQALRPSLVPDGEPRRLTHQAGPTPHGVAWAPDGKSVIYSSNIGSFNVWRVSVTKPTPQLLELGIGAIRPAVARTGNRLAFVSIGSESDIWKFEAGAGPTPVASSNLFDLDPQLSPDGRRIALASERTGRSREIWIANVDGSGAVRLTDTFGKLQGTPRWSPDGRWIAYDVFDQSGDYSIYVLDAAGGSPRALTDSGSIPSWSRDGKWIYFRSNRSGKYGVWRIPSAGGTPEQLVDNAHAAWESWDGTELYYSRGGALYARPLPRGPERQVLPSVLNNREFFPTRSGIFYAVRARRYTHEIRYFAFATGRSETLYTFDSLSLTQGLSVSPDEKTIIFSGISPSKNADLMLVQNFR